MLRFPSHTSLPPEAAAHVQRFRTTSFARELDEDARAWAVVEWTWTAGPPMHVVVENEAHDQLRFDLGDEGLWRASPVPVVPRLGAPAEEGVSTEHRGSEPAP